MGKSQKLKKKSKTVPQKTIQKKTDKNVKYLKEFWANVKAKVSLNRYYVIALGIITLVGGIPTFDYIKGKYFITKHDKFIEENYIKGDLKAPIFSGNQHAAYSISNDVPNFKISKRFRNYPLIKGIPIKDLKKQPYLFVFISGYIFTCFAEDLYRGVDIFNPIFSGCSSVHLILGVRDNRLYISADFKALENEEIIGSIRFNHWELYKPNVLNFNDSNPEKLEIKDKQNNIVFSISYETNGVWIGGYFIGNESIIVMPNDPKKSKSINPLCVQKTVPNWKQKALEEIILIKSVYK
jgi:hypothetical protein